MKKELIVHKDPKSPISEIFRTLRTNIQFMNRNSSKTLLITSTLPGEGKSWVSSNLAVTFAQTGKKVILIDADMRKGRQYSIFGVSPKPGLSNYLSGVGVNYEKEISKKITDYIQKTEIDNLYLIAAGNIPPNPSELLISSQMIDLLEELKQLCDIVIIDGTPSQLVADSLIITRLVDSTILVTASNQTKKDDLKRIIANIQNVGGKISGIVLNKIPVSAKKYQESYYYSSTTSKKTSKNMDGYRNNSLPNNKLNINNRAQTNTISNEKNKPVEEIVQTEEVRKTEKIEKIEKKVEEKDRLKTSEEKTNELLKQINEYLAQEKKKII